MNTSVQQHELDGLRSEINNIVKKYAEIAYKPQPFVAGQTAILVIS